MPNPLQQQSRPGRGLARQKINFPPANSTTYSLPSALVQPPHPRYQGSQRPRPQLASGYPHDPAVHRPTPPQCELHTCAFVRDIGVLVSTSHPLPPDSPPPSARSATQRRSPRSTEGPYTRLRSPPFTLPSLHGLNLPALVSFPAPTRCRHFSSVADSNPNGWSRSWG